MILTGMIQLNRRPGNLLAGAQVFPMKKTWIPARKHAGMTAQKYSLLIDGNGHSTELFGLRSWIPVFVGMTIMLAGSTVFSAEQLTLPESLERAEKNNPELLLARKDLSVAKTQVRQAQSLYYPKINLNLDYVRYRHETLGVTSPELGGIVLEAPVQQSKDESRGNPLAQNLYLGRLGFLQTLYAGGKVSTTHRLSQAGLRRAESAVETVRHHVRCQTTENFYRLLALHQKQKILSDELIEIEKLSKQSSTVHARLALMAAQANTRKLLSDFQQQEQSTRFQYLESMGLELFGDVEPKGTLDNDFVIPELQTLLVWAKQYRAELKDTQIQEEVDQLSVELSRSERYPVFLLGGNVELRNEEFPIEDTNWNAALVMNIPIFDGFSSWARVKESRYRADQGRLRRVQLEDKVEMEVRTAHSDWTHWKNEVDVRGRQLKALKESERESFSLSQRLDYLKWRAEANINLIDARLELQISQARLTKATGHSFQP
ncbi:MAG: hypothetical protein KCHDKBKB_01720 [Elusimicrobia bacterium]|nr:hypothetical protein [Elusimicrobiota bacterium]